MSRSDTCKDDLVERTPQQLIEAIDSDLRSLMEISAMLETHRLHRLAIQMRSHIYALDDALSVITRVSAKDSPHSPRQQ